MIERFQKATAAKDFRTICDDLLAASTRKQAGGASCADVLEQRARGVQQPHIRIKAIAIQGNRADARVRTTAVGQAPVSDVIQLVREHGQFRVLSLGR